MATDERTLIALRGLAWRLAVRMLRGGEGAEDVVQEACASDAALYVTDPMARRMVKAAIRYAAEETVPLP